MQILHMSEDAEKRIEKTLNELHGGQFKLRGAESYRDSGSRSVESLQMKAKL